MNNIKEMTSKIATILGLFVFMFVVMNLTSDDRFSEWDENNDDKISKSEFQKQFTDEYFSEWNVDANEYLNEEEFHQMTFDLVDINDDEVIDTSEREWGYEHLYGEYVDYEVTVQDNSDEKIVDYGTYHDAVSGTDYFSSLDLDGDTHLNQEEMVQSVFNTWDMNNDGYLSSSEFDMFADYYSNV